MTKARFFGKQYVQLAIGLQHQYSMHCMCPRLIWSYTELSVIANFAECVCVTM